MTEGLIVEEDAYIFCSLGVLRSLVLGLCWGCQKCSHLSVFVTIALVNRIFTLYIFVSQFLPKLVNFALSDFKI